MNLQQIKYALALATSGSFSKAADTCFVTQSTLSTMIGKLESELGIVIFDRTSKPIRVTKEGMNAIKHLHIIQKELLQLEEVVASLKGNIKGSVHLGILPTIAPNLVPLFVTDLCQQFPHLHFHLQEHTTARLVEQLLHREIDIALLSLPLEHPSLIELPLYEEPFLLWDTRGLPEASPRLATAKDIVPENLWLLEEGHCMHHQVLNICKLRKQKRSIPNLIYQTGSMLSLIRIVEKHQGQTLLPALLTTDFSTEQKQRLRSFTPPIPTRQIGIATHPHFVKKEVLASLQQIIQANVRPLLATYKDKKTTIAKFPAMSAKD